MADSTAPQASLQDEWVSRVLGFDPRNPQAGAAPASEPGVGPALKTWLAAVSSAETQLERLATPLRSSGEPVLEEIADEMEGVLDSYRYMLAASLSDVDRAAEGAKAKARSEALKMVASIRGMIGSDVHLECADTNPFDVKLALRPTLDGALDQLAAQLKLQ